jgi:hypothetical protein
VDENHQQGLNVIGKG